MNSHHIPVTAGRSRARSWLSAVLAVFIAVILLVWLSQVVGLSGGQIMRVLQENSIALGLVAFVSLFLQAWFSALKWKLFHIQPDDEQREPIKSTRLAFYSSAATLFAQLLPSPLAVPLVRGLATRFDIGGSFARGAAITVYDQLFDVGVLLLVAVLCAFIFAITGSVFTSVTVAALALASALLLARAIFAAVPLIALARQFVPRWLPASERIRASLDNAREEGFDSPETCAALLRYSILRYLAIAARSCVAFLIALPTYPIAAAGWGFAVVQSSSLLPLTPGNLGITEWGWAGVEALLGSPAGAVVSAMLALRIVSIPVSVVVVFVFWSFSALSRKV